jgi:hypothetical protein
MAAGSNKDGGEVTCSDPESGGLSGRMSAKRRIEKHNFELFPSTVPLTLSLAAIKKCIEWRLQVQIAFSTEVDLAPSRPE